MIRVYDEPPSNSVPARHLRLTLNQTAVIERMAERIERLEAAMLALPAPQRPTEKSHKPTAPEIVDEPAKGFDDILTRLEARSQQH